MMAVNNTTALTAISNPASLRCLRSTVGGVFCRLQVARGVREKSVGSRTLQPVLGQPGLEFREREEFGIGFKLILR